MKMKCFFSSFRPLHVLITMFYGIINQLLIRRSDDVSEITKLNITFPTITELMSIVGTNDRHLRLLSNLY